MQRKNLLLISDKINSVDYTEIRERIKRTQLAKSLMLDVVTYKFNPEKDNIPVNSAIAMANKLMHDMEIDILRRMVASGEIAPDVNVSDRMLIVDGPLQFIVQDDGKPEFADLFYNVVGVSKSFNPMLPTSDKTKRGGTQIGAELLKLSYGDRTPVFLKKNDKGRKFGCWYLRIRPVNLMSNPLEGIIKIEKMATEDDEDGLSTSVVDNIIHRYYYRDNGTTARWRELYHALTEDQKDQLMQMVSYTIGELRSMPCPDEFKEILPFYLLKYSEEKTSNEGVGKQLSLLEDGDTFDDEQ